MFWKKNLQISFGLSHSPEDDDVLNGLMKKILPVSPINDIKVTTLSGSRFPPVEFSLKSAKFPEMKPTKFTWERHETRTP